MVALVVITQTAIVKADFVSATQMQLVVLPGHLLTHIMKTGQTAIVKSEGRNSNLLLEKSSDFNCKVHVNS